MIKEDTAQKKTKARAKTSTVRKSSGKIKKRVGIVIPVYNTPIAYFRECVESALKQTHEALEICIVHDGDYAPVIEVSLEFARKDARVSVVVKPLNEGVSIARNIGVDYFGGVWNLKKKSVKEDLIEFYVDGENPFGIGAFYKKNHKPLTSIDYIYFLDSDDIIKENLVERCLQCAKGQSLVWFNFEKFSDLGVLHLGEHIRDLEILTPERSITPLDWCLHAKETGSGSAIFVWQVLIDFKFLQSIKLRFLNQVMREDNHYGVCLLLQCKSFYMLPEKLIQYRVRTNGETNFDSDKESMFLPGFLLPLFEAFKGDLSLTKYFYLSLSWFIQKLYLLDFIKNYPNLPGIEVVINGMLNRFRDGTMSFIHRPISTDLDYYFNLCFNCFLNMLEDMPNHDPYFRPFDKMALYLSKNDTIHLEVVRFMKEMLVYEDEIIKVKNKTMEELVGRIKELEAENLRLKESKGQ